MFVLTDEERAALDEAKGEEDIIMPSLPLRDFWEYLPFSLFKNHLFGYQNS